MRDSFYFQHDYDSSTNNKILKLRANFGWEGYGIYWAILEALARENGYIDKDVIGMAIGESNKNIEGVYNLLITLGLLKENKKGIFSERMLEHLKTRKMLSEKGKLGATKRWGNSPPISPPNAKERKGKERKLKKKKRVIPIG